MFHKLSPILCISFSYEPSRQYGISLFLKTILKHRNVYIFIGKLRFVLIELPIELPIVLPIVLPIELPIVLPIACGCLVQVYPPSQNQAGPAQDPWPPSHFHRPLH